MEDIRLGRKKFGRVTLVPVGAGASVPLLAADPTRTRFEVAETTGVAVFISDKPMTATGQGLRVLATGSTNPAYDVEQYGDFVYNTVHVFNPSAGALVVAVLDVSLTEV